MSPKKVVGAPHHALFVHYRCYVLQLASMEAANATPGIKHVYTSLMTLWKFFHYSSNKSSFPPSNEPYTAKLSFSGILKHFRRN